MATASAKESNVFSVFSKFSQKMIALSVSFLAAAACYALPHNRLRVLFVAYITILALLFLGILP